MAGRTADSLLLSDDDRPELERLIRATSAPAGLALRARIVLLAADGTPNHEIADKAGVWRPTVNKWRARYAERGVAGLSDHPRPGPDLSWHRSEVGDGVEHAQRMAGGPGSRTAKDNPGLGRV